MTRVPPSRPPPAPAKVIRPKKAQDIERQVRVKNGEGEAEVTASEGAKLNEAGHDPQEHAKLAAEAWAPESHAERAEEKKASDEIHEANERAEGGGDASSSKGALKPFKPAMQAALQKKPLKDGFEQQRLQSLKAGQIRDTQPTKETTPLKPTAQVQAPITTPPHPGPADAFAVLHAAQDPGVFFKEEGHPGTEYRENPELAAAIEEAIRLLFGVRGILRITGGFNQAAEPAIIVVTTQGFGEASLKAVPAKVHRFETILAVPYDLLPLKRER